MTVARYLPNSVLKNVCIIKSTSTNTADSDEMPYDLEFQQGLPCLLAIQTVCNMINHLYTNGLFALV